MDNSEDLISVKSGALRGIPGVSIKVSGDLGSIAYVARSAPAWTATSVTSIDSEVSGLN